MGEVRRIKIRSQKFEVSKSLSLLVFYLNPST